MLINVNFSPLAATEKGLHHFRPRPDVISLGRKCNLICLRSQAGRSKLTSIF